MLKRIQVEHIHLQCTLIVLDGIVHIELIRRAVVLRIQVLICSDARFGEFTVSLSSQKLDSAERVPARASDIVQKLECHSKE